MKANATPSVRKQHLPDPEISACIDLLAEAFPKCFYVWEQRRQPLKINIHEDILTRLAGVITRREIRAALGRYTNNKIYQRRLRAGAIRFDLDGQPAGTVSAKETAS